MKMIEEDMGATISNGIMTFLFVWVRKRIFFSSLHSRYFHEIKRQPWKTAPLNSARTFGGEVMGDLKYYLYGVVELYQRRNHPERFENESFDRKNDSTASDVSDEYQIEIPEKFHQKNSYQNA